MRSTGDTLRLTRIWKYAEVTGRVLTCLFYSWEGGLEKCAQCTCRLGVKVPCFSDLMSSFLQGKSGRVLTSYWGVSQLAFNITSRFPAVFNKVTARVSRVQSTAWYHDNMTCDHDTMSCDCITSQKWSRGVGKRFWEPRFWLGGEFAIICCSLPLNE